MVIFGNLGSSSVDHLHNSTLVWSRHFASDHEKPVVLLLIQIVELGLLVSLPTRQRKGIAHDNSPRLATDLLPGGLAFF